MQSRDLLLFRWLKKDLLCIVELYLVLPERVSKIAVRDFCTSLFYCNVLRLDILLVQKLLFSIFIFHRVLITFPPISCIFTTSTFNGKITRELIVALKLKRKIGLRWFCYITHLNVYSGYLYITTSLNVSWIRGLQDAEHLLLMLFSHSPFYTASHGCSFICPSLSDSGHFE